MYRCIILWASNKIEYHLPFLSCNFFITSRMHNLVYTTKFWFIFSPSPSSPRILAPPSKLCLSSLSGNSYRTAKNEHKKTKWNSEHLTSSCIKIGALCIYILVPCEIPKCRHLSYEAQPCEAKEPPQKPEERMYN